MGVSGGIRGEQVKDDSLTGKDINESTLIMPYPYASSGNQTSTSLVYLALPGRNGWSTSFSKANHQLIAPYDGSVTKVFLRPTTGDNVNACLFQVRTNGDGELAKNLEASVVTTSNWLLAGDDEGTTEFILEGDDDNDGPAPIPKGHAFSFGILKMSGSGYGITDAVMIVEWDLST